MPVRILVVEDERKVAKALQEGLEGEGYEVAAAHTGEEGFFLANTHVFDLVVLPSSSPGYGRCSGAAGPIMCSGLSAPNWRWILPLTSSRVARSPWISPPESSNCWSICLRNQGHVVSREMIAHDVWKETG